MDVNNLKISQLRALFPEMSDEGKIDWEKLRATLGEVTNFSNERYVLNWAGKSDATAHVVMQLNKLILMLGSASERIVASVLAEHPQKVIALDRLFEGNDQLKTNTALQMRDNGVEFKTI